MNMNSNGKMVLQDKFFEQSTSGYATTRIERQTQRQVTILTGAAAKNYNADDILRCLNNYVEELKINSKSDTSGIKEVFDRLERALSHQTLCANQLIVAVIEIAQLTNNDIRFIAARALLEYLRTPKRHFIVAHHLECVMKVVTICASSPISENVQTGFRLLQILFEVDRDTSEKVMKLDGLNLVLAQCASTDFDILELCSVVLFKIVLHGGKDCVYKLTQDETLRKWYLPLINIYDNKTIKYFAYLTVIYLNAVCEKYQELFRNGIFDDVISWIAEETTHNYLLNKKSFESIDKKRDLTKLMKLLTQKCRIAQTFGSFFFCCEAYKGNQKNIKIFYEIGAVKALKRIAFLSNETARRFASSALRKLSEMPPGSAPDNLCEWTSDHVREWLELIELLDHGDFTADIDGEKLFKLKDLKTKFFMVEAEKRKIFFEELQLLKTLKNFAHPIVPSVSSLEMVSIKDTNQKEQLKITMGVAELKPNAAANDVSETKINLVSSSTIVDNPQIKKRIDVFISYRRSTGSELASLLKAHLSLKKYKIFFDVESLKAGDFGESLIKNVKEAKNFVLILSANALDRCADDQACKDWLRIEIETAVKSGCTIIPIENNFDRKVFDSANFSEGVKRIKDLNWITWHHETQNECLQKVESFLKPRVVAKKFFSL